MKGNGFAWHNQGKRSGENMIINNSIPNTVAGVYASRHTLSTQQSAQTEKVSAASSKDEIVLSSQAQSFSNTLQKLHDMSGTVRQDKIVQYENQLAAGNYEVDAQDLADKLLQLRF